MRNWWREQRERDSMKEGVIKMVDVGGRGGGLGLSLRRTAAMQLWPPDATGHCRVSTILESS